MNKTKLIIKKANLTIDSFVLYGDEAVFVKDDYLARKYRLESLQRLQTSKVTKGAGKLLQDQNVLIQLQQSDIARNEIVAEIGRLEAEYNKVSEIKGKTDEETIHLTNTALLPITEKIKEQQKKLKALNNELLPLIGNEGVQEVLSGTDISVDGLIAEVQKEIGILENRIVKNILISLEILKPEDVLKNMTLKEKMTLIELVAREEENDFPFAPHTTDFLR